MRLNTLKAKTDRILERSFTPPAVVPETRPETTETPAGVEKPAGHHIAATRIVAAQTAPLQAKLEVSEPGDPLEEEADRVADLVMRMAAPGSPVAEGISSRTAGVQRMCADCGAEEEEENATRGEAAKVQRKETNREAVGEAPSQAVAVTRTGGEPLDAATRGFMEPRFGFDFSRVRIHTDGGAAAAARSVNAQAYTLGSHVVFDAGRYSPDTSDGQRLLAHELAHVLQQDPTAHTNDGTRFASASLRAPHHRKAKRLARLRHNDELERGLASAPRAFVQRRTGPASVEKPAPQGHATHAAGEVGFVREEGLNLRTAPDQHSISLKTLRFGQRVHTGEDSNPQASWLKVVVLGQSGYVFEPRIHFPPGDLIQRDPALRFIKVRSGLSFWDLVKEMYDISGDERTKDQNMNHFINAIRAFNKDEAFKVRTDFLDDAGNFLLSGRDAKNTYLKADVDLWIPSFGVAAKMDVGSGTVRGEITRLIKKIDQTIEDFKTACEMSVGYMPDAIARRAGDLGSGLLHGLLDFAKDAVKILFVSTAAGAVIGALFGGAGAIPGAEIGFEIGLLILEIYGLVTLVEAVFSIAGDLVGQLGKFIGLVLDANGDKKQLRLAAQALAEAVGILVSAIMAAVAAYLLKKGAEALAKTKFARTVGQTRLAQWFKERQQLTTTKGGKDASAPAWAPPRAVLDSRGRLTNGRYTVEATKMAPHKTGSTGGKSQFLSGVDAETAVLDAASYADHAGLWVGNKAKVFVKNGSVGVLGKSGQLTSWVNVYRTNTGFVHGAPGNPP